MPNRHRVNFFLGYLPSTCRFPFTRNWNSYAVDQERNKRFSTWHDHFVQELISNPSDVTARDSLNALYYRVTRDIENWARADKERRERMGSSYHVSIEKLPFPSTFIEKILDAALNTLNSKRSFSDALIISFESPSSTMLEQVGMAWVRYGLSMTDKCVFAIPSNPSGFVTIRYI
jgi:hypothetical protein